MDELASVLAGLSAQLGSGDSPSGATAPDSSSAGTGETDTQGTNWDDPSNPWVSKFRGLQGTVQREVEARRQAEQQALQARQELEAARYAQQLQGYDPSIREPLLNAHRQSLQAQSKQQQMDVVLETLRQREEENAKREAIEDMARRFPGVTAADLADTQDPIQMALRAVDLFTQRAKTSMQQMQTQQRVATGADRFELPTQTSAPAREQARDWDSAMRAFVEAGSRLKQR